MKRYIFQKLETTLWCLRQLNEGPLLCLKAVTDREKLLRRAVRNHFLNHVTGNPGEETGWNFKQDRLYNWNDAVRNHFPLLCSLCWLTGWRSGSRTEAQASGRWSTRTWPAAKSSMTGLFTSSSLPTGHKITQGFHLSLALYVPHTGGRRRSRFKGAWQRGQTLS